MRCGYPARSGGAFLTGGRDSYSASIGGNGYDGTLEDPGKQYQSGMAILEPPLRQARDTEKPLGTHTDNPVRSTMEDGLDLTGCAVSVVFTEALDRELAEHLDKGPEQEDLTFAYWRPSRGKSRFSALLFELAKPSDGDRILQSNVAFTEQYARRVLATLPKGSGIALLHSHLGPGWQGMSDDDVVAERDRLAGAVWGRSGFPLLGLTRGTDGTWSARLWIRRAPREYVRKDAATVRVVGDRLRISYNERLRPKTEIQDSQVATASVWGDRAHAELARAHIGIVGLGSVGSIVAESLARTGFSRITLIDHDVIEKRNLDRTVGATAADVVGKLSKVQISARNMSRCHTTPKLHLNVIPESILTDNGWAAAMDCDAIVCCVDRPWPRYLLNALSYAHLIPVVDGGIFAKVKEDGTPLHVDWRIHRVGPGQICMLCLGALLRSDASLDRDGSLDNPDYINGLKPEERERYARRNVFAFSMSVAAHEVLQLIGMLTGMSRIGGLGPQMYHAYPGQMDVLPRTSCEAECEITALTSSAVDLTKQFRDYL